MTLDVLNHLPSNCEYLADSKIDTRSDDELLDVLNSFRPVTSTKNVWAFWNTGWSTMKPWCKRNVLGWIRRQGPEWNIRVLDRVEDSPNNVFNFLDASHFPPAFVENRMQGAYVGAHMADLVRLPCLYKYGGIWLDVSIMLFRSLEEICWDTLTDGTTSYEIGGFVLPNNHGAHQIECGYMENWFIAVAEPQNPFILRWFQVFLKYWENCEESRDAKGHPLFQHLDTDGFRPDMIDYLAQHLSFQRVRTLIDSDADWHGPDFYSKKMFLLDARDEAYYLPCKTAWKGQKCFEILSHTMGSEIAAAPVELEGGLSLSPQGIVSHIVSNCCLMKSVHGFKGDTQLSDIWNQPENHHADIKPGTCAAYLSGASLRFRQLRQLHPLAVNDTETTREPILKARLLESSESSNKSCIQA